MKYEVKINFIYKSYISLETPKKKFKNAIQQAVNLLKLGCVYNFVVGNDQRGTSKLKQFF